MVSGACAAAVKHLLEVRPNMWSGRALEMGPGQSIVITGLGVVSPIGIGKHALWDSLVACRSGVETIEDYLKYGLPVPFGAPIRDFDAKLYVQPRKSLKVMSREIQTGYAAAATAIQDAGLAVGQVDPQRMGVVYGSEMLHCDLEEMYGGYKAAVHEGRCKTSDWAARGMSQLFPLWMLKYLPNMVACHIGIANDARGPNNTIVQGEASSLLAIIEGMQVIRRGLADVMVVGGTGNRMHLMSILYRGFEQVSHRCEAPQAASRPFDADRDGMVNGEGAAAMILETEAHATARNAKILGRILGAGMAFESHFSPRPSRNAIPSNGPGRGSGEGVSNSIRLALQNAQCEAADIGFVKAHGASTVIDDQLEAQGIHRVLGKVPVTAPKSYFGNLGAGGGAVETVAAVMSLEHAVVPVTLNYEKPDAACPVNVVAREPLLLHTRSAMVLSQSRTGQAAAVLIAAPT